MFLYDFDCLQAETRCSCSNSTMRYSHSHRRDRHSHSSCCSTDQRHGGRGGLPLSLSRWRAFSPPSLVLYVVCFHCSFVELKRYNKGRKLLSRNGYLSPEGKPRPDDRVRIRRCVTRIRKDETATRIRVAARPTNDTATGGRIPLSVRVICRPLAVIVSAFGGYHVAEASVFHSCDTVAARRYTLHNSLRLGNRVEDMPLGI